MNAYLHQYQNNQVETASPEQILIMLYDGAIRFCRQAIRAMEDRDYAVQGEKIGRTMAIISEFSQSLDHDIGGRIAENLDALYGFMIRELGRANLEKDRKALENVADLLSDLRETWVKAAGIYNSEKQPVSEVINNTIAAAY